MKKSSWTIATILIAWILVLHFDVSLTFSQAREDSDRLIRRRLIGTSEQGLRLESTSNRAAPSTEDDAYPDQAKGLCVLLNQPAQASINTETKYTNSRFALKLLESLSRDCRGRNLAFSPLSIACALSMLINGAEGETRSEIQDAIGAPDLSVQETNEFYLGLMNSLAKSDPEVTFNIANSVWLQSDFEVMSDFADSCRRYFDAEIRELDFAGINAAGFINDWVAEKTNGEILQLVRDRMDSSRVMIVLNAVYFLGRWAEPFVETLTREDWFYHDEGDSVKCMMMRQSESYGYIESELLQGIELPYRGGRYSMVILLPKQLSTLDGVDGLISMLSHEHLIRWLQGMKPRTVDIELPRFRAEFEIGLVPTLKELGVNQAFDATRADFTRILVDPDTVDLVISDVLHKVIVKVDESGTEVAAATAGFICSWSGTRSRMIVDRPFVFLICDRITGEILFIGKIASPL